VFLVRLDILATIRSVKKNSDAVATEVKIYAEVSLLLA